MQRGRSPVRTEKFMNFELTDDQRQVRDMVREFAQKEVAPYIQEWDAKGQFHREVLDKMGELFTAANHNPRQWKLAVAGAYLLTGEDPPTTGLF